MMEIKVLTYNTSMIFPDSSSFVRANKLSEILARGNWDIVGLCEVYHSSLRKIILGNERLAAKYKGIVSNLKRVWNYENGLVLLSKHPLLHVERFQYQSFIDKWYNRILPPKDIVFAIADIQGQQVGIVLTHLMWGSEKIQVETRKKHIDELREFIGRKWGWEKPLLIMGDMNIEQNSKFDDVPYFKQVFADLQDWWLADHDLQTDPGYTWTSKNSKIILPLAPDRLDYILSNGKITPTKTRILKFSYEKTRISYRNRAGLSRSEYLWYLLMLTFFYIPLVPIYAALLILFNIIRLVNNEPWSPFYSTKDLSDHYALEGTAKLHSSE